MKIHLLFLMIAFYFSCQDQTLPKNNIHFNDENIKSQEKISKNEEIINATDLRCGDKNFNLAVVYKNGKKNISITNGNTLIKTIDLPTQYDLNGFSLNWARKTKEGFEISVEYGSRFYYEKNFIFICKQNQFFLNRIKINTFDKANPETAWKRYNKKIKANLSLEKFVITDYINEFN